MFVLREPGEDIRLITSASDLTAASTCEFAFLRRVDERLGRDVEVPPDDDPMRARAAELGDAHEHRILARYVADLGRGEIGAAGGVIEIARASSHNPEALRAAQRATRDALVGGADVVFQATFFDREVLPARPETPDSAATPAIGFIGYADFVRRIDVGSVDVSSVENAEYEVQDAKLARRARVTALMQLAAYAEQIERLGIAAAPEVVLILGDGALSRHRRADIDPVFRARRDWMHRSLLARASAVGADGRRESAAPVAWGADGIEACGRCEVCTPEVERTRDPLLIAGIRMSQRDKLVAAGLDTIDRVADALPGIATRTLEVPRMTGAVLERFAWQAALQIQAERADESAPPVQLVDAEALAALPMPNEGDLFFDFEGDPLYREAGDRANSRWGIDYLWGMVDAEERFTAIWAHDLAAERRALEQFVALVAERRRRYPAMKIYHYAAYEKTHLLSIAARHGACEEQIDELLREGVLVDLYSIVRRALRIGTRSYSIKKLEPLYMGDELRDEDGVTSGGQSVVEYAEASLQLASDDAGVRAEGRRRLDAIADYNRYDCVSTLRLRDWLLTFVRDGSGVGKGGAHLPDPAMLTPPAAEAPSAAEAPPVSSVAVALQTHAALASNPCDQQVAALAASAIDYHKREQKAFWWAHFARLVDPIEEWAETRDVLIVDASASRVEAGWSRPPKGRRDRRELRLRGDIAPGSTFREGGECFAVYELPAPFEQPGAAPGQRVTRIVSISEVHADGVTVSETLAEHADPYEVLPIALTPGPPPNPGRQPEAIVQWGQEFASALDRGSFPLDPVVDILRRSAPRTVDAAGVVVPFEAPRELDDPVATVTETVKRLYRSSLAVQGPPGTGKTYLAAHVISRLVEQEGWCIGVVAQSHKVVENVLDGVIDAGLDARMVGKACQRNARSDRADPGYTVLQSGGQLAFVQQHRRMGQGCVVGGTAWDFSNPARFERRSLDLLVIDEAGQFSLAPTIASSVAAQRLLLLGDPQQLPQVSQGSHPEPVDTAALGWLLGDHDTMPEDMGYFLAETRRMRPELAAVVSQLAYDGRLHAHPSAGARDVHGAGPAGLLWHPVRHQGNATSSVEEAEVVVGVARDALRGVLRGVLHPSPHNADAADVADTADAAGAGKPLTQSDVIVIAAYNAQVECLSTTLAAAGMGDIRVGTVDRFQGQEAVIAIVSLAASSARDVPRGLEFLLMRNRLNVAISRAQWSTHLVSSDRLGDGLPGSPEAVAALAGYLGLLEQAAVVLPLFEPGSVEA